MADEKDVGDQNESPSSRLFIDLNEMKRIDEAEMPRAAKVHAAANWYVNNGFYVLPLKGKQLPPSSGITYEHATKSTKQVESWFGQGGRFRGHNIGIACGKIDGAFVIDIDTHDPNKNGFDTLALLEKEHGILQAPYQSTPSGGRHYFFEWGSAGYSSTGKIGPGIDTRGGTDMKCKGHVVAWPSRVNGVDYVWEQGGTLPDMPDWAVQVLDRPWEGQAGKSSGRGNEEMGDEDEERKYTLTQIDSMLKYVEPDTLSYDQWLWIGQSIHSQHPTEEGLQLWDNWSKDGERYMPTECSIRWSGFTSGGRIRMGTLIHFAKEGGWNPNTTLPAHDDDQFADIVEEMNRDFAVLVIGGKARILIERHEKSKVNPLQPWYEVSDIRDVQVMKANMPVTVEGFNGKPKEVNPIDIWLADVRRRTYENGLIFAPSMPREFDGYFNVWRGFAVEPEEGDWSLFKDHILNIMCDGNKDHYEWVMDWMADGVQDPYNIKGTAIVMSGIEGCGKGTFASLYGALFGTHYKHVTHEDHLSGKFNAHLMDAALVFADEVVFGGNKKVAGTLKAFVSEKQLTCERKGIDAFQYRNCARLMVASNEKWFIPAGPNSRRWFVLAVSGKVANNRAYFNALHDQMENQGGLEAMMHELLGREIKCDMKQAPETKLLQDQRSRYADTDSVVEWWASCIEDGSIDCSDEGEFDPNEPESTEWP